MQQSEFNNQLKAHAERFAIEPNDASFEQIMARRKKGKSHKRMIWYAAAASIIGVLTISLFQLNTTIKPNQVAEANLPQTQAESNTIGQTSPQPVKPENNSRNEVKQIPGKPNQSVPSINEQAPVETAVASNNKDSRVKQAPLTARTKQVINKTHSTQTQDTETTLPTSVNQNTTALFATQQEKNTLMADVKESVQNNGTPIPNSVMASPDSSNETLAQTLIQKDTSNQSVKVIEKGQGAATTLTQKWILSAVFTPQLFNSLYSANSEADLAWMKNYLNNKKENDKARYSFYTGLMLERFVTSRISVGVGVFYQQIQFEEIQVVNAPPPEEQLKVNSLSELYQVGAVKEIDRNRFDISFKQIEFPLQMAYTLPIGKSGIRMASGIAYSYLFNTRSLVFDKVDSLNVKEVDDANNDRLEQHNWVVSGSIHYVRKFHKHWGIAVGPVYRQALQSLYSEDYVIRQKPYLFGLDMRVQYSF